MDASGVHRGLESRQLRVAGCARATSLDEPRMLSIPLGECVCAEELLAYSSTTVLDHNHAACLT